MRRDIIDHLVKWKEDSHRKPLILRGARQVGKSWVIKYFGENYFKHFVEINFELTPRLKTCFSDLEPSVIINTIELTLNIEIIPGETLLFIDEIQEYPKALRYFYEKYPDLHIITAGSLMEFVGESEEISIPVGRIQNYYMNPMSFGEFLTAAGENNLREYLKTLHYTDTISESITLKCEELMRVYLLTGGMPEAVNYRLESNNFNKISEIHLTLLQNYRQDFGKYGQKVKHEYLESIFSHTPGMVGNKFKYSKVNPHVHSRELKKALNLLLKAQVLQKVTFSSGSGIPLKAHIKENIFKILFLDIGLMQSDMGISNETFLTSDLLGVYQGAIAEQYVGQQLLALQKHYSEPEIFFWQREKKGSEAEIDYLYQYGSKIFPIEVKAGKTGTLKSLRIFLKEKQPPFGIRISMHPLSFSDGILSIPLFALEALPEFVNHIMIR